MDHIESTVPRTTKAVHRDRATHALHDDDAQDHWTDRLTVEYMGRAGPTRAFQSPARHAMCESPMVDHATGSGPNVAHLHASPKTIKISECSTSIADRGSVYDAASARIADYARHRSFVCGNVK